MDLCDTSHSSRAGLFQRREPQFDGIGFSTTIHLPGKAASSNGSEAVEFFSPFSALHRYEKYDCSGQQLIHAGAAKSCAFAPSCVLFACGLQDQQRLSGTYVSSVALYVVESTFSRGFESYLRSHSFQPLALTPFRL